MKKSLGSVIIGMNRSVLLEAQRKVGYMILIVFGIIVVLGIIREFVAGIFPDKAHKGTLGRRGRTKDGTAKNPLRIYSQDELGNLTRNFNEMSALIADQRGKLNKYAQ